MPAVRGGISARQICEATGGTCIMGDRVIRFAGISTDSRKIAPGELFWALRGDRYDGHNFVRQAVDEGASGVIVGKESWHGLSLERSLGTTAVITVDDTLKALGDLAKWWRHRHQVRVVCITGSTGKTTTKEMTARVLSQMKRTLKNQGNFNNLIGMPLTLLRLDERYGYAVLEMGMNHPGEIGRLTEISDPDVGVITNVGKAHLEGVGDLEGVAKAKTELIERMSAEGQVILNGDDRLLMRTAAPFKRKVVTFGLGGKNTVMAKAIRYSGQGAVSFEMHFQGRSWPVRLRAAGGHNVFNALAAATVGLCLDESPERVVTALERFTGLKGRFTVMKLPGGAVLIDDTYNANPSSLRAGIESAKTLKGEGGRLIVGVGEMMELGDSAAREHSEIGRWIAESGCHLLLAIGEHAAHMVRGVKSLGTSRCRASEVDSVDEMIRRISEVMREKDVIFIKGSRIMRMEKVVEGLRLHFGERAARI